MTIVPFGVSRGGPTTVVPGSMAAENLGSRIGAAPDDVLLRFIVWAFPRVVLDLTLQLVPVLPDLNREAVAQFVPPNSYDKTPRRIVWLKRRDVWWLSPPRALGGLRLKWLRHVVRRATGSVARAFATLGIVASAARR